MKGETRCATECACAHSRRVMRAGGKSRDIESLYGAVGTEQPREGEKSRLWMQFFILQEGARAPVPCSFCPSSFTFLVPFGITIGSAELSVLAAQLMLGTNKGTFGFRIILGLNSQEPSDGLHWLQTEWLTWKQGRHINTCSLVARRTKAQA